MKKMKIGDFIVIGLILLISISIYFITTKKPTDSNNKSVQIIVDGKIYREAELTDKNESFTIDTEYGHNIVKIEDGYIYMYESDCSDKICIQMGKIKDVGDNIICLPNRLLIKVVAGDDNNSDELDLIIK